jgi:hypothetical protein
MIPTISQVYAVGQTTCDLNAYDYVDAAGNPGPLRPGTFPPSNSPSGELADPVQLPPGDFAYIWVQFQNESLSAKMNALQVVVLESNSAWDRNNPSPLPAGVQTTYYVCNNMSNEIGAKRWDSNATPPDYPEWRNNQQDMVAIVAYGLKNLPSDAPWNLYKGGTSRIALLGAIEAPADGRVYHLFIPPGACTFMPTYEPLVAGGYCQFLPEPASVLLLAAAALLIRRR